jgi:Tol biopolymer transport system component
VEASLPTSRVFSEIEFSTKRDDYDESQGQRQRAMIGSEFANWAVRMQAQSRSTLDQIQQELSRLLASRQFADSPRLSRFLAYIVERTLADETDQMKEYAIGLAVFDRPADFDPRLDTIVRVQASKLRSRLNDYYLFQGSSSPVRIRLPRGSYIPAFEYGNVEAVPPLAGGPAALPRWAGFRFWGIAAAAVAVTFSAGFLSAVKLRPNPPRTDTLRFLLSTPSEYQSFQQTQVSPDGRKLVSTVVRKAEAGTAIYLHNLESGAGAQLPGTKDGSAPYWSPDRRQIVFTRASRLYRLDIGRGGEPVLVGPGESTWGFDWNPNGVILIGGSPGPVRQVSLSGGDPAAVTIIDKPLTAHSFPRFLPGGNRFLYLARNETPGDSAIYAGSLDGKLKKRILQSDTKGLFVSRPDSPAGKGYILFGRGGELLAQPFDGNRLEVNGAPRPLTGGIPQSPYGLSPFSASSSILSYATEFDVPGQLTWFDRTGNVVGELGPAADLGDPVISPDGSRVAFDQAEASNRDIWTIETRRSEKPTRITFDPEVDHTPVWSPDSRRIAFESHRNPPGLYVTAAEGGAAESLMLAGGDAPSGWAQDGGLFLFESMRSLPGIPSIWLLPLTGERKPRLWLRSAVGIRWPVLSPNGKWIAYVSTEFGQSNVFVQAFDAGSGPVAGKWQISVGGGLQPVWRVDGKELFYLSPNNVLMAVALKPGAAFTYDRPVPLFDTHLRTLRGPRNEYSTLDGNRFLFRVRAQAAAAPPLHVIVNWSAAFDN